MKICKECGIEKDLNEFFKNKKWYRSRCKKCHTAKFNPPTGKPNTGRFQKGHKPTRGFVKGQVSCRKGVKLSPEQIEKTASKLRGRKRLPEHIEKTRLGRLTSTKIFREGKSRRSRLSVNWSKAVRNRDGNKCMHCETTEKLHAHHLVPWRLNEALRYELSNGITLCNSCHMKEERRCFPKTKKIRE